MGVIRKVGIFMSDLRDIAKFDDNSLKQLVFFYELTKMGVVRFDFSRTVHVETMLAMINRANELQEMDLSDKPAYMQMKMQNKVNLYLLIIANIFKYSMESYKS